MSPLSSTISLPAACLDQSRQRGAPLANSKKLIGCKGLWVEGSLGAEVNICVARVGSYLVCLCVYPSVPPRAGVGTPRVLGEDPISGSASLAGGFNISREGEMSRRGQHKQREVRALIGPQHKHAVAGICCWFQLKLCKDYSDCSL